MDTPLTATQVVDLEGIALGASPDSMDPGDYYRLGFEDDERAWNLGGFKPGFLISQKGRKSYVAEYDLDAMDLMGVVWNPYKVVEHIALQLGEALVNEDEEVQSTGRRTISSEEMVLTLNGYTIISIKVNLVGAKRTKKPRGAIKSVA